VVLDRRTIYVKPLRHIACGMYFESTSTRTRPELGWFMDLLFAAPGSWNADFDSRFSIGHSDAAEFPSRLEQAMTESFEAYLLPVNSIAKFHDFAVGEMRRFTFLNLDKYGLEHGTVLAALGRFGEAQAVLKAAVSEAEIGAVAEQQADDDLRRTKSRPRGSVVLTVARDKMKIVDVVRELLALVELRDRAAIATLLHEWERQNVVKWGIEHLWEPAPFPVEVGSAVER
jgi:hypothetical protein